MHHPLGALVLAACTSSVGAGPGVPNEVPSGPGVVITDRGAVRGTRSGDVVAWLGVPYAAPPLGELRWRPPQQMPAWNGVRETSSWSQSCVEITTSGLLVGGGEDCLYLNVWAPAEVTDRLPVLVFLHGGFALNGAASHVVNGNRIYDGAYVAAHGPAIVVTLNYRLGAFGYFTSPELAAGSSTGASGNYALHDQLAALQWVHDNIRGFGGDPDHVLVFGESAGGASTCALLASPRGTGLFSAALIESGGCGASTAEAAQRLSTALVHGAGCDQAADVLACLRGLPADVIAVAAPVDLTSTTERWGLTMDGDLVPELPLTAVAAGRHHHVPVIVGTTSNEFSTLVSHFLSAAVTTDLDYRAAVAQLFPRRTDAILAAYPSSGFATPLVALITLMTDAMMTCPARRFARAAATAQTEPVRRYQFAHTYSNGPLRPFGAGHALDLPFEFHNFGLRGFTPSPEELALSDAMIGYWVRFAATGDPNGAGAAAWPLYDAADDPAIVFGAGIRTTNGIRSQQCDLWDRA